MTKKCFSCCSPPPRLPWWGNILLAIFSYYALSYGGPLLQLSNPTLQQMALAAPSFAPIVAIPWLLFAAKRLYDTDTPRNNDHEDDKHQEPPEGE